MTQFGRTFRDLLSKLLPIMGRFFQRFYNDDEPAQSSIWVHRMQRKFACIPEVYCCAACGAHFAQYKAHVCCLRLLSAFNYA